MKRTFFTKLLLCAAVGAALSQAAYAENGVTDTRILLGQSAAFSGPAAQLGIRQHAGAKAYFDSINKAGGMFGRKIEIITADDRYEANLAAANTKKLIETDKVFALFGYVGTPTSAAALPIFTAAKVPFFGPVTGAQIFREPFNRAIFNVRASYYDETEYLVERLVRLNVKNIAVMYQNDGYGQAGLAGVTRAAKKAGINLVSVATVERNSVDVQPAVDKILPTQPAAIIEITAYGSSAAYIKAMRKAGYVGQFFNVSFVGSQALADELGQQGAGIVISQVMPFPWHGASPLVAEYQKAMKESGQNEMDFSSLEGYVSAKIFTEGLRRAGRALTREKLVTALETVNVKNFDSGGYNVSFNSTNHNASQFVDMTVITKNKTFLN